MIYNRQKTIWKQLLAVAAVLVVVVSILYSNFLASHLKESEKQKVEVWAAAIESLNIQPEMPSGLSAESRIAVNDAMENRDLTFQTEIIQSHLENIPVIMVGESGEIEGVNFGEKNDTDEEFLRSELERMIANGKEPIESYSNKIYYKNSKFLPYLTYFPVVQLLLLATFIALGYIGFSSSRRAEQNRVWVGMAKETAHQLGTPISALMGWVTHLREYADGEEEGDMIVDELEKDLARLQLVADRFSKIGSEPEMKLLPIGEMLENVQNYMQRRTPKRVELLFPRAYNENLKLSANPELLEWVFENLIRNSIDSMEGKGKIKVEVYVDGKDIVVDVQDSGKGIPSGKWKAVFKPGYTTKKRGWGLGLSLAKRIVENYHNGKIFVKQSVLNEGTTFTIKLPEAEA